MSATLLDAPSRQWGHRVGPVLVCLMAGIAAIGPFLPLGDPNAQDLLRTVDPPSWHHILGTDAVGRDVLARLLHAAPRSLGLAVLCVTVASGAGVALGLTAAYAGCWVDVLIMRFADLMLALPGILLALLLAGFLGGGMIPMLIGIKMSLWPQFARMARATALGVLAEPHVEATQLAGFSAVTILHRHVLPLVLPQALTLATLGIGSAIMSISALGFLGLGMQLPVPEWGAMINETLPYLSEAPIQIAAPCVAIFLSVLGCTLMGEAVAQAAARTTSI